MNAADVADRLSELDIMASDQRVPYATFAKAVAELLKQPMDDDDARYVLEAGVPALELTCEARNPKHMR